MGVPDYQAAMPAVLRATEKGLARIRDIVEAVADEFQLSDEERAQTIPSGGQLLINNRVHWAGTYMVRAGLLERTGRGLLKITERGLGALRSGQTIDRQYLLQFPEFRAFINPRAQSEDGGTGEFSPAYPPSEDTTAPDVTPEEAVVQLKNLLDNALREEILDRVIALSPAQFERLLLELLLAMGYGGSREEAKHALGRSGDDGVDGVIDQDPLGLDRVYIQAKRYQRGNTVGSGEIRNFFGALSIQRAAKGLFATTSHFTPDAKRTANMLEKRIVLIDGPEISRLMIEHNVGVRLESRIEIKRIDEDYFSGV